MSTSMITCTRTEAAALVEALKAVSGKRRIDVKDANGAIEIIEKPYDISGTARYAIAKNLRALKPIMKELANEREDRFAEHAGGKASLQNDSPEAVLFHKQMRDFGEGECQFEAHFFPLSHLKIETNQFDSELLVSLFLVTEGDI
jgi:hypothetical protein